jgi:hypothetical protein
MALHFMVADANHQRNESLVLRDAVFSPRLQPVDPMRPVDPVFISDVAEQQREIGV